MNTSNFIGMVIGITKGIIPVFIGKSENTNISPFLGILVGVAVILIGNIFCGAEQGSKLLF